MGILETTAREFLQHSRIAVLGVSRTGDTAANGIYRRLRKLGYEVFAVNPVAEEVEGDRCYPDPAAIPGGAEVAIIGTHPDRSAQAVSSCADAGITRVWIHAGIGQGSLSEEAVDIGRQRGVVVIPGSCPLMFVDSADGAHRCLRWFLRVRGKEDAIERTMAPA